MSEAVLLPIVPAAALALAAHWLYKGTTPLDKGRRVLASILWCVAAVALLLSIVAMFQAPRRVNALLALVPAALAVSIGLGMMSLERPFDDTVANWGLLPLLVGVMLFVAAIGSILLWAASQIF